MKKLAIVIAMGLAAFSLSAQQKPDFTVDSGDWTWNARENRLYQNSDDALAKVNIPVPSQNGTMLYEYNVRYEGSMTDTHAGFGIHLFLDKPSARRSWGSGSSYLFWLNWDANPHPAGGAPSGFSAQIYYSNGPSSMQLVDSIDLNEFVQDLSPSVLDYTVPVRMQLNSSTGEFRVYSPLVQGLYYRYYVDPAKIKKDSAWVALRTNSMQASFAYGLGGGM